MMRRKWPCAGVQIPANEGVIGLTSEDTVDILSYMSDHLDETQSGADEKDHGETAIDAKTPEGACVRKRERIGSMC